MTEAAWQRAILLYRQQRWDLAERELRSVLAGNPEFAPAYAMLGIVLSNTDNLDEALAQARQSVTIDPENDFGYYAIAIVYVARNDLKAAASAAQSAIEIDPEDVQHHGLLAQIRFAQNRWDDTLKSADAGLALEPEDTDCLNLRSLALTKLGRKDEATASVTASLAQDPDNPYTHQALGYAKLHQGDAKQALTHFQEALRRDPTLDGARAGLVEALKARNPIYRMVLGWFLWLERFEPQRRVQIMVGLWLAAQIGRSALAEAGYDNAAQVVSYSWLGFVLLTACAVPIFNLLLLVHPVGRHALERTARNHALLLGTCLLVTIGFFIGYALIDQVASATDLMMRESRWFWLIYLMPIAGLGLFHNGWAQRAMQAICAGLLLCWAWWVWDLYALLGEVLARRPTLDPSAQAAQLERIRTTAESLGSFLSSLVLAAALSTWFVVLAPKGHRNRHR
mgnify:FL=1